MPYFVMFKPLLGSPLALANSEIFPSSHPDNPELSVGVVQIENRMQSAYSRETVNDSRIAELQNEISIRSSPPAL